MCIHISSFLFHTQQIVCSIWLNLIGKRLNDDVCFSADLSFLLLLFFLLLCLAMRTWTCVCVCVVSVCWVLWISVAGMYDACVYECVLSRDDSSILIRVSRWIFESLVNWCKLQQDSLIRFDLCFERFPYASIRPRTTMISICKLKNKKITIQII